MFNSLLNSPVQGIQGKDAQFAVEITVCTALEKELDQFRYMLAENGHFLETGISILLASYKEPYQDEESLKDIKELPSTSLVTGLHSLADNLDHGREQGLE